MEAYETGKFFDIPFDIIDNTTTNQLTEELQKRGRSIVINRKDDLQLRPKTYTAIRGCGSDRHMKESGTGTEIFPIS